MDETIDHRFEVFDGPSHQIEPDDRHPFADQIARLHHDLQNPARVGTNHFREQVVLLLHLLDAALGFVDPELPPYQFLLILVGLRQRLRGDLLELVLILLNRLLGIVVLFSGVEQGLLGNEPFL